MENLLKKNESYTIDEILEQYAARVNQKLENCLPSQSESPERLHQAMRYAVLGEGKRIRPALLYATGETLGLTLDRLDTAACAIELMHSYSLVHDDLPAMDDDELRRGRPTCHKAFDEATAILAGDAIQAHAFSILANDTTCEHRSKLIQLLADSSGSTGMAGGQAIDLASVNKTLNETEIETMHRLKTGALIKASVLMPVFISNADKKTVRHFSHFAEHIGLAFQIRDDILDIQSDTETLGKPQGSDIKQNKPTYPAIVGMQQAQQKTEKLLELALNEISEFQTSNKTLRLVSEYMVQRLS